MEKQYQNWTVEALTAEANRRYECAKRAHAERKAKAQAHLADIKSMVVPLVGSEAAKHASHVTALGGELDVIIEQERLSKERWQSLSGLVNRSKKPKQVLSQMFREVKRLEAALPALCMRDHIEKALRNPDHRFVIVKGHTGSGKSTQLPQYIGDMEDFAGKVVLCTQPRKLAATTLAQRVAEEFSASHPDSAEMLKRKVSSRHTDEAQIRFCTESALITSMSDWSRSIEEGNARPELDPLTNVGVVIIDEAHERNISTDVLIGLLKSQAKQWPQLKIIVMSASLDSDLFLRYLNHCPLIEIPGRTFPVDVIYAPPETMDRTIVNDVVLRALKICRNQSDVSGVLCFLTGQDEVEKAQMRFEAMAAQDSGIGAGKTVALTLYGKQLEEDQQRVFAPHPGKRKVIFATDVAETSITIDGLGFVVDCGLVKENVFDPKRNTSALMVRSISKSSADQRKGRAGRTGPGTCYRLYSSDEYQSMAEGATAEIFCRPLSVTVSTLLRMSIHPSTFDWIEAPSIDGICAAYAQLTMYGALKPGFAATPVSTDNDNLASALTPLGMLVSKLQLDPGVTNMLHYACTKGLGEAATDIAGLYGVISMLQWRGGDEKRKQEASAKHASFANADGDFATAYRMLKQWQSFPRPETSKWCFTNSLNNKAFAIAAITSSDLVRSLKAAKVWNLSENQGSNDVTDETIRRLCMQSQFMNVAVQIQPGVYRTVAMTPNDPSVVSFGHPGSALAHLARANASSGKPPAWPELLCFQSIFKSSKTFLNQLTPISIEDLKLTNAPQSVLAAVQATIRDHQLAHICLTGLPSALLLQIVGKRGSKIPTLTEALRCQTLEADFSEEILSCWCKASLKSTIEAQIQDLVKQARQELMIQSQEEVYKGQTRVVYGSGLSVQNLLPSAQDFVTININQLPPTYEHKDVENLVVNAIRKIDPSAQNLDRLVREITLNASSKTFKTDLIWAQVRMADHIWAKKILSALQGEFVGTHAIIVSPGGIRLPSVSHSITAYVDIIAATEYLNGGAHLFYNKVEDANDVILKSGLSAFANLPKPAESPAASPFKKYHRSQPALFPLPAAGAPKDSREPSAFVVAIKRSNFTEAQLLKHLQSRGMPKPSRVITFRGKPKPKEGVPVATPSSSSAGTELENLAELQSAFNFLEKDGVHSRNVTRDDKAELLTIRTFFLSFETASDLYDRYLQNPTSLTRYEQPVAVEPCFTATFSVHQAIAALRIDRIRELLEKFNLKYGQQAIKVKATEMGKNVPIEYRFTAPSLSIITQLAALWHATLSPSGTYEHHSKSKLFSLYGRKRMEALSKTHYLHWLNASQTIYIYSKDDASLAAAKSSLDELVQELEKYELGKTLRLEISYATSLRNRLREFENDGSLVSLLSKEFGADLELADAQILSTSLLVLTGTPDTISQLEKKMTAHIWKLKKNVVQVNKSAEENECPICFCDADYTLQACGHRFCRSCLETNFTASDGIHAPLKCPGAGCKAEMTLSDILSVTSHITLDHLKEDAVYRYVRDSTGSDQNLVVCPSPTCGQILSAKLPSAMASESMLGGHVADCDLCRRSYCMACSTKEDKPVTAHPGASCSRRQLDLSDSLSAVRLRMLDLLITKCPNCNGAIFDFNGCYALTCNCGAGLCGFCLYRDPSGDAHSHVRQCVLNPTKNEYFAPPAIWQQLRRNDARARIVDALKKRPVCEKAALLESLAKDLSDLGLHVTLPEIC
jgi:HrpA-like RNA helicase